MQQLRNPSAALRGTILVQWDYSIEGDNYVSLPGVETLEEAPVTQESFQSGRLTTRLMQQVQEPLMLATRWVFC